MSYRLDVTWFRDTSGPEGTYSDSRCCTIQKSFPTLLEAKVAGQDVAERGMWVHDKELVLVSRIRSIKIVIVGEVEIP